MGWFYLRQLVVFLNGAVAVANCPFGGEDYTAKPWKMFVAIGFGVLFSFWNWDTRTETRGE